MGMRQTNFEQQLLYGKEFEDNFSRFLIKHGWYVTPKYLFTEEGAPSMFGKQNRYALPDIDAAKHGRRIWVECKRKSKMKYHPATGYAYSNHICYKAIQEITGDRVFVVFEDESLNKTYGNWLSILEKHIYRKMLVQNKLHILFKYPDAFVEIKN